ncbi:glycoside hydrolase family 64 protein [Streptomyces sp. NPDC049954]|uniref:glycoside hydrolase family 64 protein n=1 Tax=Streptomyces sp. NPDC049954 TaxID=3155779 RepID=UPI003443B38C
MPPTAASVFHRRRPAYLLAAAAAALLVTGAMATGSPAAHASSAPATPATRLAAGEQPPDSFWGDTSGIPEAKNVLTVKILNKTNGQYPDDQVYWTFGDETHSIAEQPYLDMPANSAGRMTFHLGAPDGKYSDFIEFTVGDDVFNGNTTRVDAFAVKLAMRLHAHDGYDVQVGEDYQTFQEDRATTFQKFRDEVPAEFKALADDDTRIPAPGSSPDFREGGKYANYLSDYANSAGIDAPTSDIFGCAGILANEPGKCSAVNRHVAGLPEGDWSKPELYYKDAPANYYAKFWHDHSINNLAYGFPYDDYAGQSSFVSHGDPQWLEVAVGW